jgi:2-keto-3-deoxy-L-rhamnonate aldolase RhmA
MTEIPVPGPWVNPVKARLARGEYVVGMPVTSTSVDLAALAARSGFDFLWVEMEHSPITLETLRHIVLATRGLPAVPIARVPGGETWMAKRVLDQGVHGVVFPFTSTAAAADQAARACRYPPRGRRGSGAGLAEGTWPTVASYFDSADDQVLVVVVIEEAEAVECCEEIAAIDGIDVLFVGTSDLSFSMGLRGNMMHPDVLKAAERVRDAAVRHGKYCGRPVASPESLQRFADEGFRLFHAASDLTLFAEGAKAWLDPLGRAKGGPRAVY